jgi:hypothetical protein
LQDGRDIEMNTNKYFIVLQNWEYNEVFELQAEGELRRLESGYYIVTQVYNRLDVAKKI